MRNLRAQLLMFAKWRLHQDLYYIVLKKEKRFWSDNKYVLLYVYQE